MTRIAIIETGRPPGDLADRFGDYPTMFRDLLGPDFETQVFDAQAGDLPDPAAFDGVIVTGSPAGVYEEDVWITRLLDWIRDARGRTRLVGICFGHQALAQALGGRVEKSDRGWGVGLQPYDIVSREPWMTPGADHIAIPASHQDQVVDLPPGARVTVASDFAPIAGLAFGDDAISFQAHPEFPPAYAAALVEGRRGRIDPVLVDRALTSLEGSNDNARLGAWIRAFLTR